MSKNIAITITGPSGAGKTELEEGLVEKGYGKKVVSITTRSRREGEEDGVDYHYVTKEVFEEYEHNNDLIESVLFSGNHYGAHKKDFHKISILVCEPTGQAQIAKKCKTFAIGLTASKDTRIKRMSEGRGDNIEAITKRIKTDDIEERMANIYFDLTIDTENLTSKDVLDLVLEKLSEQKDFKC